VHPFDGFTACAANTEGDVNAVSVCETTLGEAAFTPTQETAMPRLEPDAATPDPRLARTLWQWLALGLIAVLVLPAARGPAALLGSLPFWLLAAPCLALLTLYRGALAAAWREVLVRAPRRRRRAKAGQARRHLASLRQPQLRRA